MRWFLNYIEPKPVAPHRWTKLRALAWLVLLIAIGFWALVVLGS
jgi:hypothetical protein